MNFEWVTARNAFVVRTDLARQYSRIDETHSRHLPIQKFKEPKQLILIIIHLQHAIAAG
jgi:hypothetical protein